MKTIFLSLCFCIIVFSCADNQNNNQNGKLLNIESNHIFCGDILNFLDLKPAYLMFEECRKGSGQVLFEAIYYAPGTEADVIENFFIFNCNMGKLKFVCCGWEPENGKTGGCEIPAFLRNINSSLVCSINMFSEETLVDDRTMWNDTLLFYVVVNIIEC